MKLFDADNVKDSEFAFFVELRGTSTTLTWNGIAGAFEFRNGILMRNGSDPFTPLNNCVEYPFNPDAAGGIKSGWDVEIIKLFL